jgi:nitrite reductase/ring-hydroxylating ferredoxin subunit
MLEVEAGGEPLLLVRVDDALYAVGALCTHAVGYLADGELEGFEIVCPLHAGSFDVRTGAATRETAEEPLPCYRVRIDGNDVTVEIPS